MQNNIFDDLPYNDQMRMLTEIHAALNKMQFNGMLKSIKMDICNIHDNIAGKYNAVYRKYLNPLTEQPDRCILIDSEYVMEILPAYGSPADQILCLMELVLHEMIHQYCDENGITDESHCGAWSEAANVHGLDVEIWDEEHDDYLQELDPEYLEEFESISRELLTLFHLV